MRQRTAEKEDANRQNRTKRRAVPTIAESIAVTSDQSIEKYIFGNCFFRIIARIGFKALAVVLCLMIISEMFIVYKKIAINHWTIYSIAKIRNRKSFITCLLASNNDNLWSEVLVIDTQIGLSVNPFRASFERPEVDKYRLSVHIDQ